VILLDTKDLVTVITESVLKQLQGENKIAANYCRTIFQSNGSVKIPVGVSNRHVHLSKDDFNILFGNGAKLSNIKDLSQPGQYACEEKVTLVGPKGVIENVRILGPIRNKTQVELSISDCIKLGVKAPIRDSGDLEDTASITLVGPQGSVTIKEGTIIAARHIHLHTNDAKKFSLKNGDRVSVRVPGLRGLIFNNV